ncbi:MAG TPA: glycosyltransferase family 4 protein [Acidimicrobiia bacterium]|nr:glycosyltransferase family 4 protein [Acidimicrobiia bacterium]
MNTPRPMRVALLCPYSLSAYGGVQLQVLGLARALRARGVDARILAPTDGPPPMPGVTSLGPTVRYPSNGSIAPLASMKAASRRTLEAFRVFEPDVLHLHEPLSPGANHAALIGTDIPAVGTFHAAFPGKNGWYEAFRLPLRKMVERLTIRTAVSEEAQRNVERFGASCEILPNGVDVLSYADAPPTPSPVPAICFVGRHERRKGIGVLLDAFTRLERDAVLWVVGEGPETEALQARPIPRVEWLGSITEAEKASRLRGATIAAFPSVEGESFGVVLLEAMAASAALVASDLTGYRHVARDGREAFLVSPDDPAKLAQALRRVLDDPALRSSLVAAGRTRADEFSLDHLADAFVERYELAIKQASTPIPA